MKAKRPPDHRDQLRQALENIFEVEDTCQAVLREGNLDEVHLMWFKTAEGACQQTYSGIRHSATHIQSLLKLAQEWRDDGP